MARCLPADSARHRFLACQQDLQAQLAAAEETAVGRGAAHAGSVPAEAAALHCRLGAVSGCLGDCCRAEGDADGMLRHYQRSVELLQAAGPDPEARLLWTCGRLLHACLRACDIVCLYSVVHKFAQFADWLLAALLSNKPTQLRWRCCSCDGMLPWHNQPINAVPPCRPSKRCL